MITKVDDGKCIACGICIDICPLDVLRLDGAGKAYIAYPDDCMTCFQCQIECLYEAIDVHPFREVLPPAIEYPLVGENHG